MKDRFVFLLITFFRFISTEALPFPSLSYKQIIHSNSELGKAYETLEGDNIILSKRNDNIILISKLDKKGNFIYHETKFFIGYIKNAKIIESKIYTGENGYSLYYKSNGKEYLSQFKDKSADFKKDLSIDSNNFIASILTLKNGKIFYAGIQEPKVGFALSIIELKIIDPISLNIISTLSLNTSDSYYKFVSCTELKYNEVYCVYVQKENITSSSLKIQYFKVSISGNITQGTPYSIKSFNTQFNSFKLIKISFNRIGILFQMGDSKDHGEIVLGNKEKNLYFFDLKVTPSSIKILEYDIFNQCLYNTDDEDNTIDLIAISEITIYAICEKVNHGKNTIDFQLIKINSQKKNFEIIPLEFQDKAVKNPSLIRIQNSVGIIYTRIDYNDNKDIMLFMINYPYCEDTEKIIYNICPNNENKGKIKSLNINLKIYLLNPFPKNMNSTKLYYKIIKKNNMKIFNDQKKIELNKDYLYSTEDSLIIKELNSYENTYIQYTVFRKEKNEIILGRTCLIKINFTKCKEGYYPKVIRKDTTGFGNNDRLNNSYHCDIACTECYGTFDPSKLNTFCHEKKCNYEKGYYPWEKDTRICINEKNKTYWDKNLKCVLFLDKTNRYSKEWRWKCCHKHCSSCHLSPTTDNNNCDTCLKDKFYFFINQTKENGLIPGNCHENYEGNGFYKCGDKMCPCLLNCKKCNGKDICEECNANWLLSPERTFCNKTCDYCLTPYFEFPNNKSKGRCVNCKEFFTPPRYTFENKCLKESEIPEFKYKQYLSEIFIYEVVKKYHVYDEKCNMLTGCKEGCLQCSELETDKCTKCDKDYYMEDPFGKENKTDFLCFKKEQCLGNNPYLHRLNKSIGGVPIEEDNKLVCLNCKQRYNSYRQPEGNYWCGPLINGTFVDIPEYNKLTKCYYKCKTCDRWGNSHKMSCTSCRDSAHFELIRYDKTHGQCYQKYNSYGMIPYYHKYDLTVIDDNCGEYCDIYLFNYQCPKEFPFLKDVQECVEFCHIIDIIDRKCYFNNANAAIIFLSNPFGLRNPYESFNLSLYLREILSIYESAPKPPCGLDLFYFRFRFYQQLFSYIVPGKPHNLKNSYHIFSFNNISLELSSVKLELQKINDYAMGNFHPYQNEEKIEPTSGIDLSSCQDILKKKYGLPKEEDFLIIKTDIPEKFNFTEFFFIETYYQLYSYSLGALLPLSACKEERVFVELTIPFASLALAQHNGNQLLKKLISVLSNGYDVFNANSSFYNDICTPYTNENGKDVLLDLRRKDYYNENINLCSKRCKLVGYNIKSMVYTCRCNIKATPDESANEYRKVIIERFLHKNFKVLISNRTNIAVFKCTSIVFSSKGYKKNFGSYILLICFVSFVGILFFHFLKEESSINNLYNEFIVLPNSPRNNEESNKKKENKDKKCKIKSKEKESYDIFIGVNSSIERSVNIKKDLSYKDYEMNISSFNDALKENNSYLLIYWNLLKIRQLIIYTFFSKSRGILRSTKILIFILFFANNMAFTAFFFNDNIIKALYIYQGNINTYIHLSNIILSSFCSHIVYLITRYVFQNKRDIFTITNERNNEKRKVLALNAKRKTIIKLYILYGISAVIIIFCWYYVSAFCAVFKNSQKNYLINFFFGFFIYNLWPFFISIISTIMIKKSLDYKFECLYKVNQILSLF